MSDIHVQRIKSFLQKEFDGLIDLSDLSNFSNEDKENHFLTRSQSAFAISYLAEIDNSEAAKNVCDGFDDNGIDAIYYDEEAKTVYVIQSKWVSGGSKSPELGGIDKFIKGFKDLIAGKFERFNDKVKSQQNKLEDALLDANVTFVLVIVYTGSQPLSQHAENQINDLLKETNDTTDVLSYKTLSQKELYKAIANRLEGKAINLDDVTLYEYGQLKEPYNAVYGQVSAEEIAGWYQEYDTRLLAKNLRKFKGDTEVNLAIKRTLISEPEKFWYFNNGITVLCEKIRPKPKGANNRDIKQFLFEGVSVVNGAQTVGVVATTIAQGFPKAKQARVLVRFISLEDCPAGFGIEVTTATNTQNRIEVRDFASLDPNQERLSQELLMDLNKLYAYKSGDKTPALQDGCTIEEATIALACAYPEVQLAADAKRNISKLWEDIKKPPYTKIFNNHLTTHRLWKTIEIHRAIQTELDKEQQSSDMTKKRVVVHGNRFIMHRVFQQLPLDKFDNPSFDITPLLKNVVKITSQELAAVISAITSHYQDVYLNTLFKSGSKCEELSKHLPKLPSLPKTEYHKHKPEQPPLL